MNREVDKKDWISIKVGVYRKKCWYLEKEGGISRRVAVSRNSSPLSEL
jgi:hypothetical protein